MVNKEKLKSLLLNLSLEPDLSKVNEKTHPIAILREEHDIILKNLDDLERVLDQAINIIQRIRRIRTTRNRQLLPPERQMHEIVGGR